MNAPQPTLDRALAATLRAELVQTVDETRSTTGATVVPLSTRSRRRRTGTRLALVAASVAALAMGASMVLPGQSAYAGWSATPTPVTGERAATLTQECADQQAGRSGTAWAPGLSEQRGRWVLTMIRGADGSVATCQRMEPSDGASTGQGPVIPATPLAGSVTVLADNGIFDTVSRDPRVTNGWFGEPEMEGHHLVTGVAGADVQGIVLHTVAGDVAASLEDGLWAAWWPVEWPRGEGPGDTRADGATLSLTDGTTVELTRDELDALRDLGD